MSLGIEQILPADGSELTTQLYQETARWVARWSKKFGIPIRHGAVSGFNVTKSGVIRHSELGSAGGGHSDPGTYNFDGMLSMARAYRAQL